jgi:GGDEF domain-containing protein
LAGDRAISMMGKAIRKTIRDTDVAGRYGGDEFSVLLGQTGDEGAERAAERVLEALQGQYVQGPNGDMKVSGSLGVVVLNAHDFDMKALPRPMPVTYFQDMMELLIGKADAALYAGKKAGGGRICRAEDVNWTDIPLHAKSVEAPPSPQ